MPIDWTPFVEFIRRHQRILMTTHVRPDGDGLGSMLALARALETLGKEVKMTVASVFPPRYEFLDPQKRITQFTMPGDDYRGAQGILILDTGTWNQLGYLAEFLRGQHAEKMVIDHHVTQDDLGGIRLVDTEAEATGRLAHEAITSLGVPLDAEMASALFVALAMDTGWFRHSNTSARSLTLAGQLVSAGANPERLHEALFEQNSHARIKLVGRALSRMEVVLGGRVAYSEIHLQDYQETGALPQDSEDLVTYTRSIMGVDVGLFFMEQPRGGIKVSFRSRASVDVARIAERFNGGGHRQASGAIIPDVSLEEAQRRVLEAIASALPPA